MKICFFTENYYEGGLDTFLINLVNSWPNERDDLTLICNNSHAGINTISKKIYRPFNIYQYKRIFTSHMSRGKIFPWAEPSLLIHKFFSISFKILQYPILFPWYVFSLTIFFLKSDYDRLMVVNGGYPASLLCRSASIGWWLSRKKPLSVMNFHNSTSLSPWYYKIFENFIDRLVLKSSSHIISVSKNCLSSLNNRDEFSHSIKLSYIYNGIEKPKTIIQNNEKILANSPYCLMLATYEERKGHHYLLRAFQEVVEEFDDIHLQIYGYGSDGEKKIVSDEISRLNLKDKVILGDFKAQVNSLIANASVLVVPSQAYESFGLTIIEAMSLGVPVVTTDVGGMPEVMGLSEAGFICSKDNHQEFANAIKNILRNKELAFKLGQNGKTAFNERFLASKMSKQYAKLIIQDNKFI
jgi:L-malate glycosyltransferase